MARSRRSRSGPASYAELASAPAATSRRASRSESVEAASSSWSISHDDVCVSRNFRRSAGFFGGGEDALPPFRSQANAVATQCSQNVS